MTKAVVINIDGNSDLVQTKFEDVEEARKFVKEMEWKAFLIIGDNLFTIDHT